MTGCCQASAVLSLSMSGASAWIVPDHSRWHHWAGGFVEACSTSCLGGLAWLVYNDEHPAQLSSLLCKCVPAQPAFDGNGPCRAVPTTTPLQGWPAP